MHYEGNHPASGVFRVRLNGGSWVNLGGFSGRGTINTGLAASSGDTLRIQLCDDANCNNPSYGWAPPWWSGGELVCGWPPYYLAEAKPLEAWAAAQGQPLERHECCAN